MKKTERLKCKLTGDLNLFNLLELTKETLIKNDMEHLYKEIYYEVLLSTDYIDAVENLSKYIKFYV